VSTKLEEAPVAVRMDLTAVELRSENGEIVRAPWFPSEWARFAVIAAELALVVLIMRLLELEDSSFRNLAILVWAGFVLHHLLPLRLRLPFFLALSLASLLLVGPAKVAASVVAGAFVLITVCHLPVRLAVRVGLLVAVGLLAGCLRVMWVTSPINLMVITILATMFMFRVIIYLYDVEHKTAPAGLLHSSAYFLMLPSAFFPLFPVVDYKTFCSTYYNGEPIRIYQTGLRWIVRGVVQLVLYRLVYQRVLIDPLTVTSLGGVAQFMVATYLLYLQVSGRFHLIVGILHLFGFNLPETHHRYYLAASFTDFWRRINS
jgi:D-alanyl-lipoteichoic acid acyltransferase DltB (MBOAT superfamily)